MKFLLVDNFDSFTYNIVHYFEKIGVQVDVVTNKSVDVNKLSGYNAVVLSPGPGLPSQAGELMRVIANSIELGLPILGICLGMQALAEFEGSELYNQQIVKHGVGQQITVHEKNSKLYTKLPSSFTVGLYHSWAVKLRKDSVFEPTAFSEEGVLMSFEDEKRKIYAVQYHPESILTENGLEILQNFTNIVTH